MFQLFAACKGAHTDDGEMKIAKIEMDNGVSFSIEESQLPLTIGRSKSCDIRIHERYVSRVHCELFLGVGRTLCLKDLSANGTMVDNKTLCGEAMRLKNRSLLNFSGERSLMVKLTDDDGQTLFPA